MIKIFIFIFSFLQILSNGHAETKSAKRKPARIIDGVQCPSDNQSISLEDWRDALLTEYEMGRIDLVVETITKCFPEKRPHCVKNLLEYSQMKLGLFTYTNELAEKSNPEKLTLTSEKELPAEFLVPNKPGKIRFPKNLMQIAAEKKWDVLNYKTRGTGGFDTGNNLSLVIIPGDKKDIYMQISPHPEFDAVKAEKDPSVITQAIRNAALPKTPTGDLTEGQTTLTVITVDKTVTPPIGQLRNLAKFEDSYGWENKLSSSKCISCHTSPLRSLSPVGFKNVNGGEQKLDSNTQSLIEKINERMGVHDLSWGQAIVKKDVLVSFGPAIDSQIYGWAPPNSKTRKPEFVETCKTSQMSYDHLGNGGVYKFSYKMKDPNKIRNQYVVGSMNCVGCHNGRVRGPLHDKLSIGEIFYKVLVDKSMPPGAELTDDERLALVNCLAAEKSDSLIQETWKKNQSWLNKDICTDFKN